MYDYTLDSKFCLSPGSWWRPRPCGRTCAGTCDVTCVSSQTPRSPRLCRGFHRGAVGKCRAAGIFRGLGWPWMAMDGHDFFRPDLVSEVSVWLMGGAMGGRGEHDLTGGKEVSTCFNMFQLGSWAVWEWLKMICHPISFRYSFSNLEHWHPLFEPHDQPSWLKCGRGTHVRTIVGEEMTTRPI